MEHGIYCNFFGDIHQRVKMIGVAVHAPAAQKTDQMKLLTTTVYVF